MHAKERRSWCGELKTWEQAEMARAVWACLVAEALRVGFSV